MRSCVHQPAAGGHVKAARCGKSTPEATRRGSKRAAATREGGCVHTRPRPSPLFTTRPRLAVRTELTLCALARRLPTHQWVLSRSNFTPARVGTVASELGRAAVPQGGFQADGQAPGGPYRCDVRVGRVRRQLVDFSVLNKKGFWRRGRTWRRLLRKPKDAAVWGARRKRCRRKFTSSAAERKIIVARRKFTSSAAERKIIVA